MPLFPTMCGSCRRCALTSESALAAGARCIECSVAVRPIPGARYDEGDTELFDGIFVAVREAQLSSSNAARLKERLEQPLPAKATDLQRLNRLVGVLPSLALIDAMIDGDRPVLRRAESMLTLILEALSYDFG